MLVNPIQMIEMIIILNFEHKLKYYFLFETENLWDPKFITRFDKTMEGRSDFKIDPNSHPTVITVFHKFQK